MSQNGLSSTSVRPHTLCTLCRSFWAKVTCIRTHPDELFAYGEPWPEHHLHSPHRSEAKLSASTGCHFCSIIIGRITGCTGNHGLPSSDDDGPIYISIAVLGQAEGTFLLTLLPCEQREILCHDQILNQSPLRLCPTKDDSETAAAPDNLHLSTWQTNTWSQEAADFINAWLRECQTTHALCGPDIFSLLRGLDQSTTRPKRLLDLQASQDSELIQLVDAENIPDLVYCTISYSWGFSQPYVMTSANLMEFQRNIPLINLPNLLKDAIQIVRGLGLRYLWIDALCIMQDGHTSSVAEIDWYDQIAKMYDIFGNSVMTIAASESFDGDGSLTTPRNPLSHTSCRLDAEAKIPYEVVQTCTPHCELHPFDHARYHLDTRAWVFQERILSPRTVHITRNFIHLECRTELRCEAASNGNPETCHHHGAIGKADYHTLFACLGPNGLDDFAVAGFLSYWHELMRKYSATNLCRPGDVLVALAGLIKQVQARSQLTSSFGLWREHILHEMLWYVRGGKGTPLRERAPSWSWASIEVQGPQIIWDPSIDIRLVADVIALPEASEFVPQPPLSTEESRYIVRMAGRLKPGHGNPLTTKPRPENDIRTHRNCLGIVTLHPECPFHPDYELPENIEVYHLLIARVSGAFGRGGTAQSWETEVGIVLTPVAGYKERYRRVGYFHHDVRRETDFQSATQMSSIFENCETQEVEIV